jgi:arylsulfatase A-like enzyme/tetratricopeptide (TPR) repeat protein
MRLPANTPLRALILAALAFQPVWPSSWAAPSRPFKGDTASYNVLLVTLDTTRADRLGCYGYPGVKTPSLDAVARRGVLFESAYAQAVETLPSHATMLTGLIPPRHGVRLNGSYTLGAKAETLAEILRAAGFGTRAAIAAAVLGSTYGLAQGFDAYDDALPGYGPRSGALAERSAGEVTDAALALLDRAPQGRWFLWVHYFDPHWPYRAPAPWSRDYAGKGYEAEIAYMDSEIGRLLSRIEAMGAGDRTIVAIAGDHGEGLLDHGEQSHGVFLYDETARVPMIMAVPGFVAGPKRVGAVVRTTDILPTLLDLLKLPPRPDVDGTSLWPLMAGQERDLGLEAYTESIFPFLMHRWSPMASLRKGRYKLIAAPKPELYDVSRDTVEKRNLLETERETAKSLERRLSGILREATDSRSGSIKGGSSIPPEEQARLRSLGYVGGAEAGRAALESDPLLVVQGGARGLPDPKDRVEMLGRIERIFSAYSSGEHEETVSRAREFLTLNPESFMIRRFLADSLLGLGRPKEALAEYRTVLKSDPDNLDAWLAIAGIQMESGDLPGARGSFSKVLASNPDHLIAITSLGNLAFVEGDFARAEELYRKALSLRSDNRKGLLSLAHLLEARGAGAEARKYLVLALELDPGDAEALVALGRIQLEAKDYAAAVATLDRAAAVRPHDAEIALRRGEAYLATGRIPEAEAEFQKAARASPGAAGAYHGLGMVAAKRGDSDSARRWFEKALKADPSFAPSREMLRRLSAGTAPGN